MMAAKNTTGNDSHPPVPPPVPPPPPEQHQQENLGNVAASTFTTHDVVLGKGNGINSLPGNLRFRKIIVKYKPLYAATPRSLKGTIAEMVINEIACLDPPGRFLEPQADQRFRQVSRKRAIEKTCQALREKKNNIGPASAGAQNNNNAASVVPSDNDQHHHPDNNNNAADAVAMQPEQSENPSPLVDPTTAQPHPAPTEVKGESNQGEGSKDSVTVMENDVLYGGRGRRHFHRLANQRFLELVKMSRKEYHESRCKKAVAKRIVKEWQDQTPPGRFLQQDPKTEKWYEIGESKIMEKTCQALRDMKRERGPAGVKHGISDRMVDPWDRAAGQPPPHMNGPMHHPMNGPMSGQSMPPPPPPQGHHHPYRHHPGAAPWMGQPNMYQPQQMMQANGGGGGMMPPQMAPPYVPMPPQPMASAGTAAGMGQGPLVGNAAPADQAMVHEPTPPVAPDADQGMVMESTPVAPAAVDKRGSETQGAPTPMEEIQPVEEQSIVSVQVQEQPPAELKQEVHELPHSMEVEEKLPPPPPPPPQETPTKTEEPPTPAKVAPAIMPVGEEVTEKEEVVVDDVPKEADLNVVVEDTVSPPPPAQEGAPSERVASVPGVDNPTDDTEPIPLSDPKDPAISEVKRDEKEQPVENNVEEQKTEKSEQPDDEAKESTSPEEKSTSGETKQTSPKEENASDAPPPETEPKEDEKKEGDEQGAKGKVDKKKSELEAAALLANMFR